MKKYRVHFVSTDKGHVTVWANDKDQAYKRAKEKFQDGRFVEYSLSKFQVTDYEELEDEE